MPSFFWYSLRFAHLAANSELSRRMGMKFPAKELLLPTVFVPTMRSIGTCIVPNGTS